MHDPAVLDVLCLPFATGALAWPTEGAVLFEGAHVLPGLEPARRAQLRCAKPLKPLADELVSAGYAPDDGEWGSFGLALVLPPRQREQGRARLANALRRLAPGGTLVACQANDEGARSLQSDVEALCGEVRVASKKHCRVVWTGVATPTPLATAWAALDAPRQLDGWWTRPGVFAWDRLDAASALLIEHLPTGLAGAAADLGAGTGVLASALLARNPALASLELFEADSRALDLARLNLGTPATRVGFHWHDVTSGIPGRYDAIVMNPPFHVGRADLPQLGQAFVAAAADALRPGGRLWLVANRHLPYEATLAARFALVRTLADAQGFKVLEATK
jgi:16S rRNA (guanine1207-N2)-methyltransferase